MVLTPPRRTSTPSRLEIIAALLTAHRQNPDTPTADLVAQVREVNVWHGIPLSRLQSLMERINFDEPSVYSSSPSPSPPRLRRPLFDHNDQIIPEVDLEPPTPKRARTRDRTPPPLPPPPTYAIPTPGQPLAQTQIEPDVAAWHWSKEYRLFALRGEKQTFEIMLSARQLIEMGRILQDLLDFGCPGPWINETHKGVAKHSWQMQYLEALYGEAARQAGGLMGWEEGLADEYGIKLRSYEQWVKPGFDVHKTRRDFKEELLALRRRMLKEGSGSLVCIDATGEPIWQDEEDDDFQMEVRKTEG
jgi:hypothetical protein